jgi:hypothetical protein
MRAPCAPPSIELVGSCSYSIVVLDHDANPGRPARPRCRAGARGRVVTVRHPSGTRYLPRTIEHGRARDVPGGARATRAEAERALEIALAITRPCGVPTFVDRATYLDAAGALGLTTEFTWDAFLALDGVPFEEASRVPAQLAEIEDAMQAQPGLSSTRMVSGLDTLFDLVDLRVKNLRVPILLVVFQIGAVTLAVLAGVGSLTLTRQTFELAVLHSRGFSRRTLLAAQGAQALLYAAVAFPLGLLLGLGLAKLAGRFNGEQLPGVEFPARLNDGAIWLGLAVALVGALVLLALSQDHRVDRRATPLRPNARSPRSLPVNNGRQAIDLPPVSASRGAFDFRPSFPAGSADRTTSQACRIRPG